MSRLAVVAGHSLLESGFPSAAEPVEVETARGAVSALDAGDWVYLQRHGADRYVAPHAIDHAANVAALAELGCDRILALGSTGSLRAELAVGAFVAPDDFISLQQRATHFDDARGHLVPGFDERWRAEVLDAFAAAGEPLRDGGTYWQFPGPRFETPAEVRLIAAHADIVGMTVASECILAAESGLRYAAVCVIDNLANGVAERRLTVEEFAAGKQANRRRLIAALERALPALCGVEA